MKQLISISLLSTALAFIATPKVDACTNFIVTPGASADGSTMVTYAADSHVLYGELYYWAESDHVAGSMLEVREWDTNRLLSPISQVAHTWRVIGNINQHQVTIAETTFGGKEELTNPNVGIDYGSLIYIALQRSTTALEAIKVMTSLAEEYGFCSAGESFSIADPKEAWILEMVGAGKDKKGATWVARRIPDGYVSGHANQARITTFPKNDPKNCLYSKNVVETARELGLYNGTDEEFSFADAYAPLDFGAVRFCEARVFSGFRIMNKEMMSYEAWAMGDLTKERLPLWIKPDHKISKQELADIMRDHYEGTQMDMTQDVGAGPFHCPYRWRPMEWEVDGETYVHERAIATQQTGFWFVSQMRTNNPDGILWFGCDDANTSVLMPFHTSLTEVPEQVKVGNGDLLTFSWTSAFWLMNWVANMTYSKYDGMIGDVRAAQRSLESRMDAAVADFDKTIANIADVDRRSQRVNTFAQQWAKTVCDEWKALGEHQIVKYIDGNVKKERDGKFLRTQDNYPEGPDHPKYDDKYYRNIVAETGEKLKERK
ncbi:MAG: C69 family dipeptidase [Bacteroidia bacterium]|nr:C69 family dipeptidase [Bacteroidia bacterium]